MSQKIAYANTYTTLKHDSHVGTATPRPYKIILDSQDATSNGMNNQFAFHVDVPNLVAEGNYHLFVDNFLIEGTVATITNVAIVELMQTRSFASYNRNNDPTLCSVLGNSLQKDMRPLVITDSGLFANKTLTVELSRYTSTTPITDNWQLTLVLEKI